ncbi:hypothetical protein BX661DRAFT_616 [Kickxella alabastrina]|uniref:uncharacterized protein n=1 Tax=Kickxella alabastrina TaxID=61397 RepID=UPI00221F7E9F|nr:uncharacterized protein BX661DRAFT_616 [Kickxella alabastrina]KAI7834459.1 hypothetical protein BX661DRAFT_616 [Kickxella alabastrina]
MLAKQTDKPPANSKTGDDTNNKLSSFGATKNSKFIKTDKKIPVIVCSSTDRTVYVNPKDEKSNRLITKTRGKQSLDTEERSAANNKKGKKTALAGSEINKKQARTINSMQRARIDTPKQKKSDDSGSKIIKSTFASTKMEDDIRADTSTLENDLIDCEVFKNNFISDKPIAKVRISNKKTVGQLHENIASIDKSTHIEILSGFTEIQDAGTFLYNLTDIKVVIHYPVINLKKLNPFSKKNKTPMDDLIKAKL